MRKIYFVLLILVVLVGGFVKYFGTTPTFEGDINFRIHEIFTKEFDGPHLYLSVLTEKIFPCSNYGFEHSVSTNYNTIKVILDEITEPNIICLTAPGPASFSKDLNLNEGTYTLEFHSKDKIDKYAVIVSKVSVLIESIEASFTKTEQTKIDRLPENLLWADCFYDGEWKYNPRDDHCERFFSEIETFAQPYLTAEEGKTPRNQFYLYTGEDQPLINLIQKYDREKFYVKISTWEGKSFFCHFNCLKSGRAYVAYVPKVEIEYLKEPRTDISKCDDNVVCIMEVAFTTKNEKVCEHLSKEDQGQCFGQVGIAKLDESLCVKTGSCFSCQEECYSSIAIQKSNPDLCEEMTSIYRDDCYISYAEAKNDISFCEKVVQPGRVKWCLDKFK